VSAIHWIRRNPLLWLGAALVVVALLLSSVFRVPETGQALILRFKRPPVVVNAYAPGEAYGETGAGLGFKVPFLDRIVWVEKRVLDLDLPRQNVRSADQDGLEVDAFAQYRIVDPLRMYVTVGNEAKAGEALKPMLATALRNELGRRQFEAMLSPERDAILANVRKALARPAAQYGAQIVDVRIKRIDLPQGDPLKSAFERMRSTRQQMVMSIVADGNRQVQTIRGNAEAAVAQIYSESFGKDPGFYDFYRAMQSYQTTFGTNDNRPRGSATILLSPDNDYLRQFMGRKQGQ
jgi:modulator of FtsH protease HflC